MLIINARVYTLNDRGETAEAVAIRDGRILATGSRASLRSLNPGGPEIDAGGRAVLPGFVDAHAHLSTMARGKLGLSLAGETSTEAISARVSELARSLGSEEWVTGRGWDQNLWSPARFPTRALLDAAAPNHPVALTRVDGHATWVNGLALRAAAIDTRTPDPPGGLIVRDAAGEATGVLVDAAQRLLRAAMPAVNEERLLRAIQDAIHDCLSVGLTGIHEMGLDLATIALHKRLIDRGEFPFRVYGAVGGRGETWDQYRETGPEEAYGQDRLTVRSLKLVADGALGSRGAALLEPYSDDPENRGLTLLTRGELIELAGEAAAAGFQVCTHAIGDRANRDVLDAYETVLSRRPAFDHRFRVEHAQILSREDLPRFRRLQVLPSMQATHCTSDMPWARSRLGEERLRFAYPWRSLLDSGVVIPGGSDFPVESPNPFLGLHASVTRRPPNGGPSEGWNPAQRMTRLEAVRSFTTWAAFGAFEERVRGKLAGGYAADLVVLSADPLTVADDELPDIHPLLTIVAGEIVYDAHELA